MVNLVTKIREVVRDHPDGAALSVAGTETSYGQLWSMTGQFAGALSQRGLSPGDVVAIYLPNLPQFVAAFHATLRAGGVVVPINPQYKARELEHILADSEAMGVVTLTDLVPVVQDVADDTDVEFVVTADGATDGATSFSDFLDVDLDYNYWEVVNRDDDAVAVLPYTSGTTGDPKGVELTHRNLAVNAQTAADLVPDGIGIDDSALGVLPLFHIYGMTVVMNATLFNGGTYIPAPEWDAETALGAIEREEVTIFHGVPAMYNDIVNTTEAGEVDLSSIRLAGVGGAGIPREVLERFESMFDVEIYEGYGLTETSPVTHFNAPEWGRRVGSIGKTVPGVEAMVVDGDFDPVDPVAEGPVDEEIEDLDEITGELVVAGENVMKGYHDLPEANEAAFTEEDGTRWFHTGDVAYHDEDGFFYVVDRMDDVIVTAGYNVYPREVEELLFEHAMIADAAVVGIPDDRRGETVMAYIVPNPGSRLDEEDVQEYCLAHLAEYKHPRVVEFVDELPRTTTGKVQKYELRDRAEGRDLDRGSLADGDGDDDADEETDTDEVVDGDENTTDADDEGDEAESTGETDGEEDAAEREDDDASEETEAQTQDG